MSSIPEKPNIERGLAPLSKNTEDSMRPSFDKVKKKADRLNRQKRHLSPKPREQPRLNTLKIVPITSNPDPEENGVGSLDKSPEESLLHRVESKNSDLSEGITTPTRKKTTIFERIGACFFTSCGTSAGSQPIPSINHHKFSNIAIKTAPPSPETGEDNPSSSKHEIREQSRDTIILSSRTSQASSKSTSSIQKQKSSNSFEELKTKLFNLDSRKKEASGSGESLSKVLKEQEILKKEIDQLPDLQEISAADSLKVIQSNNTEIQDLSEKISGLQALTYPKRSIEYQIQQYQLKQLSAKRESLTQQMLQEIEKVALLCDPKIRGHLYERETNSDQKTAKVYLQLIAKTNPLRGSYEEVVALKKVIQKVRKEMHEIFVIEKRLGKTISQKDAKSVCEELGLEVSELRSASNPNPYWKKLTEHFEANSSDKIPESLEILKKKPSSSVQDFHTFLTSLSPSQFDKLIAIIPDRGNRDLLRQFRKEGKATDIIPKEIETIWYGILKK